MPPAVKALLAQLAGWTAAAALARGGLLPGGIWPLAAVQALAAAGVAALLRSARWWLAIHLVFSPLVILASALRIAPAWYLGAFGALVAIYWTSFRTQVPLFLSNRATVAAVARLLPGRAVNVLDIGSGLGSLLRPLARLRPDSRFTGIEAAPGPYLVSRLLAAREGNLRVERGDFFAAPWAGYDVVYAFLSPVPMARVWAKASREMRPGSMLICNSFGVPDVTPAEVAQLDDARGTRLFVYRIGAVE